MTNEELTERRRILEEDLAKARAKEAELVAAAKQQAAMIHTLSGALQENAFWLEQSEKRPTLIRPNGQDLAAHE